MPYFSAQQSLFRAYDIRGAQQYFTVEFVEVLGEAFAQLYNTQSSPLEKNCSIVDNDTSDNNQLTPNVNSANPCKANKAKTVVIGYDVRYSSDTIAQTLAHMLNKHKLTVVNLGLVTTPMMAFWAKQYDGHGIMVTASHSAKDTLGIKWLVDNTSPSGGDIKRLYHRLLSIPTTTASSRIQNTINNHKNTPINTPEATNILASIINLPADTVATTYIDAIAQTFTRIHQHHDSVTIDDCLPSSKLAVTIVIDCMNGATSNIAQHLFGRFCQHIIMLNDRPDGNFPTGNPDPTEPNRLAELQQTVIVNEADMGLAFDGDGDRLMIVDNSGKVVTPDHLLYLLAQVAITEQPISAKSLDAPQVIFDVKCSHHLPKMLCQLGATPVMSKTGSSLMRQQLQSYDSRAIFAGELSGHFIFNDGYFIVYDDAMYAGLRLLHWLMHTAVSIDIVATLGLRQGSGLRTPDAKFVNDNCMNALPTTTDLWGNTRPLMPPYKLTAISQYLPNTISTADHYLPLPETTVDCSIVQQLVAFCGHLQRLIEVSTSADFSDSKTVTSDKLPLCSCFVSKPHITLAQAKQLLPLGTSFSCIDGIRLDFARGFGVLRQSNTSHSLTVRFAGDSIADLIDVQARFVALCHPFDKKLAEKIAAITHN